MSVLNVSQEIEMWKFQFNYDKLQYRSRYGIIVSFPKWRGNNISFGVGYCMLLVEGSFHNLYFGDRPIVPRHFISQLNNNDCYFWEQVGYKLNKYGESIYRVQHKDRTFETRRF